MNKKFRAYAGLILMTLIIGFSFLFVKMGQTCANSYDLLAHRFNAAFLAVLLLRALGLIKIEKTGRKEWLKIVGVSLFYPVMCFGFQTVGLEYASTSQAGIILALLPILTLFAGALFLKEKTSVWQKAGIAVSVAGLIFLFASGSNQSEGTSVAGTVLLLLSVVSMVVYYMIGKKLMQSHDSMTLTSIMVFSGFIIFNVLAVGRHAFLGTLSDYFKPLAHVNFLISVVYLGVLSSVLTSFLSNYALIHISTTQISVFNNLIPLIAIAAGVLLLGEHVSVAQIIGGTAVLTGVVLVVGIGYKQRKQ